MTKSVLHVRMTMLVNNQNWLSGRAASSIVA